MEYFYPPLLRIGAISKAARNLADVRDILSVLSQVFIFVMKRGSCLQTVHPMEKERGKVGYVRGVDVQGIDRRKAVELERCIVPARHPV